MAVAFTFAVAFIGGRFLVAVAFAFTVCGWLGCGGGLLLAADDHVRETAGNQNVDDENDEEKEFVATGGRRWLLGSSSGGFAHAAWLEHGICQ
ncbi:MAG TPA: hypothetical protein VJR89_00320 [Polyangiales bacterium]|nr:hypothetical protein [Polyangiales bacterium]